MYKNYLLTALRNIRKNKTYSFINIAGLSTGIAVCIIILLFVQSELSYDTYNKKYDRIYRIIFQMPQGQGQPRTPHPMAQAMAADFPEVETAVSMSPIWGPGLTWAEMSVRYKDNKFYEKRFFSADTNFFDVFSIKTIKGNSDKAIREAGSVIITQGMAEKYFGSEDPIGKTITLDGRYDVIVKAVIEDIPQNSHFSFDFLISYLTLKPMEDGNYYTWGDFGHYNYIVLKEGADYREIEKSIPGWIVKYINFADYGLDENSAGLLKGLKLQPLKDIHLKSHLLWELTPNGNESDIYIFSAAAILILLIACINFMNISTARAMGRAKEVGVRKSVGAERKHLIIQFLSESFVLSFIATVFAVGFIELFLPAINTLTNNRIFIEPSGISFYIPGLILLFIVVGFISGSYPAFFLSSFKPYAVLSGKFRKGSGAASVRRGLLIFQFVISAFLVSSTLIIYSQLNYIKNKNLGFDKEQVIAVPLKENTLKDKFVPLKEALIKNENIAGAAGTTNIPGSQFNQEVISAGPGSERMDVLEMWVDENFFSTLGVPVVEGRTFSKSFGTDSLNTYLLNEAAAKRFNWNTTVGKYIDWIPDDKPIRGNVIGVVKNFNYQSLHENIRPLLIHYGESNFNNIIVRLKANRINEGIEAVKKITADFDPGFEFEYRFLDNYFADSYRSDEQMGSLFLFFSIFAIFIALLGLFGLAAFMAEQKTKEIGIRKILGASVSGIVVNLNSDFIKRVIIANIIALPAAYFIMNNWLQNFAYHIAISWWVFALTGVISLLLAIITVSWQAVKAALINPVKSLKYE